MPLTPHHRRVPAFVAGFVAALAALSAPAVSPAEDGLQVRLEPSQGFYYAGDPILIRLSLRNHGVVEVRNPVEGRLEAGLRVRVTGGEELAPDGAPAEATGERPERIAAKAWETSFDAASIFRRLRQPGSYELSWSGAGLAAPPRRVRVIQRYDPTRRHAARVVTSEGTFEFDLLAEQAPIAVKAFVDLAHAGYYDGLAFDHVQPGEYVTAGRLAIDDLDHEPLRFPAEPSAIPLVPGIVVVKPIGSSPPTNSQEFAILLGPQHLWAGQVTVLGRVTGGLEGVQRISRVPSTGEMSPPFFKPLKEIKIQKIEILDRGPVTAG